MPYTPDTFANSATSTVQGGAGGAGSLLNAGDTSLQLMAGDGSRFPPIGPSRILLGTPTGAYELATMTANSSDILTLTRASEDAVNHPAQTWGVGTPVQQVTTAGNLANLWSHIANLQYNVKDFGAKGDGTTDDTTAIAAAIAAAIATNQLAAPNAPNATGNTGAGSAFTAGQTVNVAVSYVTAIGETLVSPNTLVTIGSNANNVVVTQPAYPVGVLAMNVYVSTSNGSATLFKNAVGTNYSSQTSGGNITIAGFAPSTNNAVPTVNSTGGAAIYWPAGTYISTTQTVASNVYHRGDGPEVTTVKLKNATNADLFSAFAANINLAAAGGASSNAAAWNWGFSDMSLDGNYANQSSGPCYPLRVYGFGYTLRNFWIKNGYSGGFLGDYNGAFPQSLNIESTWVDVRVFNCRGATTAIGIEMGGPHDSRWTNVLSYYHNSHAFHIGPNNGGLQPASCHGWNSGLADANSCTWLVEASLYATNCEAEGSPYAQLVILGNGVVWVGGSIYSGGLAGYGVQIGQQAAGTNFTNSTKGTTLTSVSSYYLATLLQNISHANGAIWLSADAGGVIIARVVAASGTNAIYTGTIGLKTTLILNNQGFNDARQQILHFGGEFAYGQSATTPDPGNNGTITTAGLKVTRVSPAAAETGIILQAGTRAGQAITVINNSAAANTLTMAVAATSNVANGVTCVINGLTGRRFTWDSGAVRWFPEV